MANFLHGIEVILHSKKEIGKNPLDEIIYEDVDIKVSNVLVGEPSTEDITQALNMHGKKLAYKLGIPKSDTNDWKGKEVSFWNQRFRVIGIPVQGIDDLIPLDWNKKVGVEAIE